MTKSGVVVCMQIKLDFNDLKADIERGLEIYAFNLENAEKLFRVPVRHDIPSDSYVLFGKINVFQEEGF